MLGQIFANVGMESYKNDNELGIFEKVRGQNAGGQNAGQICIGGQNAGRFWGRVDKIPVSSNHILMKNNAELLNSLIQTL